MTARIRHAEPKDAVRIASLYNHYVRNSIVTFEEDDVSPQDMAGRIAAITASFPWLVMEEDGTLAGYAYARKYHERAAYRHTVETAVYVDHTRHARGLGTELYRNLLDRLPALGIHAAIGLISIPNPESIALHEKCGFKKAGHVVEVGFKFGHWVDVGYWQKIF